MKKILIVFGTRPEAIKMAPVVHAFQRQSDLFETRVCITGQHRQMLDSVLKIFDINPGYDLAVMEDGQDLFDLTAKILKGMRSVLDDFIPDMVLVHGDTTTSAVAALAAFYRQIPVAHVEAGLRTNNLLSPWPEELNRQITGRIANLHFAPTRASKENLLREHVLPERIFITGNTVIDALRMATQNLVHGQEDITDIRRSLEAHNIPAGLLDQWGVDRRMVLITGHRRENFGDGFLNICAAIKKLSTHFSEVDFVYPVHLNPSVLTPVYSLLQANSSGGNRNIYLLPPVDYLPFVYLMKKSHLILTDSGGVQEEAPGLGKPVIVMRDTTERPEAVEAGTVRLAGTDPDKIFEEVSILLTDASAYDRMSRAHNPYGDGKAAERILSNTIAHMFETETLQPEDQRI